MAPRRTADQAAATRDDLIDAALDVFSERGYAAAQLEEIALRAKVTRGALYHHFANKAELYLALMHERWSRVMEPLWRGLDGSGPSRERVRAFVAAYFTALGSDRTVRALLKTGMSADGSLPELRGVVQAKARAMEGLVEGLARAIATDHKPAAARQAAVAVVAFLNGVAVLMVTAPSVISPARDAARLADACVDGALR